MAKPRILVADNNQDYLNTLREFLQAEFDVFPAADIDTARAILQRGDVVLAVLDIRMVNDDDEKDETGLELAKHVAPEIPKIMLTRHQNSKNVRDALKQQVSGLPAAVDFVAKQEGRQAIMTAIRRGLKIGSRYKEVSDVLAEKLTKDHEDARQQARLNWIAGLAVAMVGITLIFVGAMQMASGDLSVQLSKAFGWLVVNAIAVLFFRRSDQANDRMDRYHRELMELQGLDTLLAACEDLNEDKERSKRSVIETASSRWLGIQKPSRARGTPKRVEP